MRSYIKNCIALTLAIGAPIMVGTVLKGLHPYIQGGILVVAIMVAIIILCQNIKEIADVKEK